VPVKEGGGISEERPPYDADYQLIRTLLDIARDTRLVRIRRDMYLSGRHVAGARVLCGLSPPRFAELLGVDVPTLQRWERDQEAPAGAARTVLLVALRFPEVIQAFVMD
tara:strand:+ start:7783 stop:8109 length:327 start_codon:yes stop_codon:yes gene_type:complete